MVEEIKLTEDEYSQEKLADLSPAEVAEILGGEAPAAVEETLRTFEPEKLLALTTHLLDTQDAINRETESIVSTIESGVVGELMLAPTAMLKADTTVAGALDFLVHIEPASSVTYLILLMTGNSLLAWWP